jgi:hypothetical protein
MSRFEPNLTNGNGGKPALEVITVDGAMQCAIISSTGPHESNNEVYAGIMETVAGTNYPDIDAIIGTRRISLWLQPHRRRHQDVLPTIQVQTTWANNVPSTMQVQTNSKWAHAARGGRDRLASSAPNIIHQQQRRR